jgi:acylaminoacyl-peptidase
LPDTNAVTRSVRDIDQAKRRKLLYTIPLGQNLLIPPTELDSGIKARVPSPSGSNLVILREEDGPKNSGKRQILELWTNQGQSLTHRVVLPKSLHGKVVHDPNGFGCISWNAQETAFVYSAERKNPETASFFDPDGSSYMGKVSGGEFTLGVGKSEGWGEKYGDLSGSLDLFCCHVKTGRVAKIENIPGQNLPAGNTEAGWTLGQAIFSPCGQTVVYTSWDAGGGGEMPRRLGMVYCMNRPCKIYSSPIGCLVESLAGSDDTNSIVEVTDGGCVCLTNMNRLSRSPRFAPAKDGLSRLYFLSSKLGFDTHDAGMALHSIDWDVDEGVPKLDTRRVLIETILDPPPIVDEHSVQVANMCFPGLYVHQLPRHCCTSDYMLTTTQWGSVQKIIRVSVLDGSSTLFNVEIVRGDGAASEPLASQQVLCVTVDGGVIISESAPNRPTVIGYVSPEKLQEDDTSVALKVRAVLLAEMSPIAASSFCLSEATETSRLLNFTYDVLTMRPPQIQDEVDTPVQWILMKPKDRKNGKKPPLIVVPHGGPHSCTSTAFNPAYAYLCAQGGYAILHVNYRGSTGFGQRALDSLPGHVGLLDVKDIVHAVITISDSGWIDPDRIGICGGSHGGFLAAHCIGQFPDMFKAAAMRNPVTNIASMVTATDIPDWCFVEALGCGYYNMRDYRGAVKEEMSVMWDASPIKYAHDVVAPTLIALGMSDRRVPPSQGLEFYHAIRARGVTTKLLQYEHDDHAIDNVNSEADHWINIKRWFDKYL